MSKVILTLTTDFGLHDSYVAEMKGSLLSINPQLVLVDVTHLVPPHDVAAGAYLLARTIPHFPNGTVHLAIVDPGVGTDRRPIAIECPVGLFVGPDNGLFALAMGELAQPADGKLLLGDQCQAVVLTKPAFWQPAVSLTFHGRDIFAPVAAGLAAGQDLSSFGDPTYSILDLPQSDQVIDDRTISGCVLWIDHFGNVILNVHQRQIAGWKGCLVEIAGQAVTGLVSSYEEATSPRVLVGSAGLLEIALYRASAARDLQVSRGVQVIVRKME